jgi:2-dehydro-3-deoxygalactonokinase
MREARFIAADWGTSHLRLVLCDANGLELDSRGGPGAADVGGSFADVFDSMTSHWGQVHGLLPAVMCGMVGSSIGWIQAPYLACPVPAEHIVNACATLRGGRIRIVPGLSCRNRFNAPDFLRGEETQVLGALTLEASLRRGVHMLCHPGTHTKWMLLQDGNICEFLTAPTGELFAALRDHSVLVRPLIEAGAAIDVGAFKEGVAEFCKFPEAQLLHRLFECRSRRLSGELSAQTAEAYMSGLLIASDVQGALRVLADSIAQRSVVVIGSPKVTELYAIALASHGYATAQVNGELASLAGLCHVYQHLSQSVPA